MVSEQDAQIIDHINEISILDNYTSETSTKAEKDMVY